MYTTINLIYLHLLRTAYPSHLRIIDNTLHKHAVVTQATFGVNQTIHIPFLIVHVQLSHYTTPQAG